MHLSALELSLLADNELDAATSESLKAHINSCTDCREQLALATAETQILRQSLEQDFEQDLQNIVVPTALPKFTRAISLREFALINVVTGGLLWLLQFVWKTLFGEAVISALSWFSIPIPDAYEILLEVALYFSLEGESIMSAYLGYIVLLLIAAGFTGALFYAQRSRNLLGLGLACLIAASVLTPTPASALEIRHNESTVTISADEVINDTLMVAAETVVIEGDVDGNLIAAARRIIISGEVTGNVIAFARTVNITSEIGGTLITAADTIVITSSELDGDVWAAGSDVRIDENSEVGGNATIASEFTVVDSSVGRDLYTFSETTDVSGQIAGNLEAFVNTLNITGGAIVEGDVNIRSHDEDALIVSPSAIIKGETVFLDLPESMHEVNRYTQAEYYLHQLVRLAAALVTGLLALWLIPALRSSELEGGMHGLATAGLGLVTMISIPVIALILMVTVIGIPLGVLAIFGWLVLIYLAKIIVASQVGRLILRNTDRGNSLPLTLGTGLLVVILVINLPGVGGIFNIIMTLVGLGMMVRLTMAYLSDLGEVK